MKKNVVLAVVLLTVLSFGLVAWAGGPLRVTFAWPTYIDPAVGSDFSSSSSLVNLYDTLVYPNTNGDPLANVATSWDVSSDGLTWTFHLRSDVLFHDGTPLTASDVKYSMDRLTTIGQGYAFLFVGRVKSTQVIDDHTVQFNLSKPFGPFLTALYRLYIVNSKLVLAHTVAAGAYGDNGDYGTAWLITNDAGSGPYMVKDFAVQSELDMVKNPHYWQPMDPATPDAVSFIGTTEPATIRTMMSRKELEISDQWQPEESLKALSQIAGVKVASFEAATEFYLMLNTKKPPTDDIHFRLAMAYATDYTTVVNAIFPGSVQARGPVPQSLPGADPNVFQFTRDLAKARAELAQSKYAKDLAHYPVVYHWIAEVPDEEKVALSFMSNMADIGITVKVVKVPWLTVVQEMGKQDTSPNIVSVFDSANYPEAGSLLQSRYASASAPTWEQNEWLLDPTLDGMITDALATTDRGQRFAKYGQIEKYIVDLCPTIFLFDQAEKHAYQSSYVDWPAANGQVIPVMGYNFAARFIKVND